MVLLCLYAGLRPFNFFSPNQVRSTNQGLRFGPRGIAYTPDMIRRPDAGGFSIRLKLQFLTLPYGSVPRVMSLVDEHGTEVLYIGQWKNSLIIRVKTHPNPRAGIMEASTGYLFSVGQTSKITISSGPSSTRLFVNDSLVRESAELAGLERILRDGVHLVLANNPLGTQSWKGVIQSVSLFDTDMASQVGSDTEPAPILLYTLARSSGNLVSDSAGSGTSLRIPDTFRGLNREFLVPVWAIERSRSLAVDMVVNLVGFIPFGVLAFFFFRQSGGSTRAVLLGILGGVVVSLTIEVLQVYLPGRTSQMTDLILNSAGTVLGVTGSWAVVTVRRFGF